ncbi:MAG: glycosyltransferase [Bryobacteraceae bacterium]
MNWLSGILSGYETAILVYLLAVNSVYFILVLIGFFDLYRRKFTAITPGLAEVVKNSRLSPPISILAPAFNEAATVRDSVRAMLSLDYPEYEVVVINDGSTDVTLDVLVREFHLYKSARYYSESLASKPIRAIYESLDPVRLVIVDKDNGGKADALNAGLNVARYPLVCAVDTDSLIERDALLRTVMPFVEDPSVIGVGGIVRVANGCDVSGGRVTSVGLPRSWMARFQVVEYLRAFLGGRVALSSMNSLLLVSGAFGVFSKKAVLEVGGYRADTVGEDLELVVRLHRFSLDQGRDYRIVFLPDPVCWTEVPESLASLRRQRNRWQRGTIETMWQHRSMIGRPRYGVLGMFAMPYFLLFEMLGPLIETAGYALTIAGLALGALSAETAMLFFLATMAYGILLSVASVTLEEMTLRRYPGVRDMLTMVVSGVVENLGFRQMVTVWRALAFVDLIRGRTGWGAMERKGFQRLADAAAEAPRLPAPQAPDPVPGFDTI